MNYELSVQRDIWSQYEYLLGHYLCSIHNAGKLKDRVRELYFEADCRDRMPNLTLITGLIDEENIEVIENFYKSYGYNEREVEQVTDMYNTHISTLLDVWIEDILKTWEYPFCGSAFNKLKEPNYFADDAQNVIFPDFL